MERHVTVFTPTYNRGNLLKNIYESLLRQTDPRFKWLVIDDGSADDTGDIVASWIAENKIDITYVYKENGGLHTAYNAAIERLDTELAVCIDSDDWMPDNAVEIIIRFWDENKASGVAGIIGLDVTSNGELIGDHLENGKLIYPVDLLASKTNKGDKKYVVLSDLYKKVAPMPVFEGERYFNPHYMILKLSAEYKFVAIDSPLCVVDYQPDGMSSDMTRQYLDSPRSYAELRRVIMRLEKVPFKYMMKTAVHYVSSSILAKDRHFLRESPRKLLTLLAVPFGVAFTIYINRKKKR